MVPGGELPSVCASGLEPGQHLVAPGQLDGGGRADPAGDRHPRARFLLRTSGRSHWGWGWAAQQPCLPLFR